MLKKRGLLLFLSVIIGISLIGCNKEEEKNSESKSENEIKTEQSVEEIEESTELYEDVAYCENRGKDIYNAIKKPTDYKGKKFTLQGVVESTKTSDDGVQEVLVNIITDTYLYESEDGSDIWIKLNYNPDDFSGERLVEGDEIGVVAKFIDIINDEKHGDIALFDASKKMNNFDYVSIIALEEHFKSLGASTKDMGLHVVGKVNGNEELETIVQKADYDVNGMTDFPFELDEDINEDEELSNIKLFSTEKGIYWIVIPTINNINDMVLYSAEKNDEGDIEVEYKGDIILNDIEL